jgi:hypothetical protein
MTFTKLTLFSSLDNSANGTRHSDICCELVVSLGVFSSLTVSNDNKSLNVALALNYQYGGLVFKG